MRIVVFLLTLFVSQFGLAALYDVPVSTVTQDVNATMGFNPGFNGKIYYECRSLERKATDLLEQIGATNVDLRCTGGFDPIGGFTTYARLSGTFNSKVQVDGSEEVGRWVSVKLRDRSNCALVAELLKVVKDKFVLRNVKGKGSHQSSACKSDDSYNVTLEVVQ